MVATMTRDDLTAARIREIGTRRTYPARSFIFHEADESSGVLLIESGLARIDRTSISGRVVLLDLASAGRVIGELGVIDDQPRSATISTITDVVAYHVSAGASWARWCRLSAWQKPCPSTMPPATAPA